MTKYYLNFILVAFVLTGCATTSQPAGPGGTGEHKAGYDLGRSDAVKEQYWMVQNLQKQTRATQARVIELPITIPGQTTNGVTTVPHTETIRIQD